jgi:negative regulator of sigma E activity
LLHCLLHVVEIWPQRSKQVLVLLACPTGQLSRQERCMFWQSVRHWALDCLVVGVVVAVVAAVVLVVLPVRTSNVEQCAAAKRNHHAKHAARMVSPALG